LPDFSARTSLLAPALSKTWPELRHPQLAAHVLVEMLLDRFIMRYNRAALDLFYQAFSSERVTTACSFGSDTPQDSETLQRILSSFSTSRFLEEYLSNQGLVSRFLRSLSRTPFAPVIVTPIETIAEQVPSWENMLEYGSFDLLEEVRQALALREFESLS
jgi:hypothetical protein